MKEFIYMSITTHCVTDGIDLTANVYWWLNMCCIKEDAIIWMTYSSIWKNNSENYEQGTYWSLIDIVQVCKTSWSLLIHM